MENLQATIQQESTNLTERDLQMMGLPPKQNNSEKGSECCDEIDAEDGRNAEDNGSHKGDWGPHLSKQQLDNIEYEDNPL